MDFPSIIPDRAEFYISTNTQTHESALNRAVQHKQLPGDRWQGLISFSNRGGSEARQLKAFVFSLQGPAGRFDVSPPDLDQQGTMAGTGNVSGANQTGKTLATDGWDANQTTLFDYGDYFEVNGELKMITEPISSDAGGNATLKFVPPIRFSPADAGPIEVTDPRARNCYLTNDKQAQVAITSPIIYSLSLAFREDVT